MSDNVFAVDMGEYKLGQAPAILVSTGVGSCIVICLYDRTKKLGAMGHAMLPKLPTDNKVQGNSKIRYVDQMITMMIADLIESGSQPNNLVAKLAGGANMFTNLGGFSQRIGEENTELAQKMLAEYGIEIVSESVGGTVGRGVEFNLSSGVVSIISKI